MRLKPKILKNIIKWGYPIWSGAAIIFGLGCLPLVGVELGKLSFLALGNICFPLVIIFALLFVIAEALRQYDGYLYINSNFISEAIIVQNITEIHDPQSIKPLIIKRVNSDDSVLVTDPYNAAIPQFRAYQVYKVIAPQPESEYKPITPS